MSIPWLLSVPLCTSLLCLIPWKRQVTRFVFIAGSLALAAMAFILVFRYGRGASLFAFGGNLMMDALSGIFVILIASVGLLASIYAGDYLFRQAGPNTSPRRLRRYAFFFHVFIFTMLLTVCSNNLGVMWIAIEGTTLASAFLVNVDDKKSSIEAAWKYLILCTVGIALALFGIILVYYSAVSRLAGGEGEILLNWTFLLAKAQSLDPQIMKLAFIFILVGYGTKAGLAPFHSWLPDAHSQAPGPVSALLSGVLLSCATFGIVRFHILTQAATGTSFSSVLLIVFGLLSVAVAVPFILEQSDYKRLLAYSSVEHMGLAAIGFGFGGIMGNYGALLHIVNHAFTKSLLFFSAGHLLYHFQTKHIKGIQGIFRKNAFLGIVFFSGILAISGMPPFSMFVSEFSILAAGFLDKNFLVCFMLLFFLTLIFAGFLRHASQMTFGAGPQAPSPKRSVLMDSVLGVGMILILMMGFYIPAPLNQLIQRASQVIGGVSS
ncbi:MAG: hydrogenase 4 subunit F [Candidatus Omnitrophica bacterium]|nr:hydrogenase 4 subunit F [Candidatus Omnitrophota bacterium]